MKKQYAICETRYFYGPKMEKARLLNESGEEWRGTYAEACKLIEELDIALYYLASGEYCRACYTIVKA